MHRVYQTGAGDSCLTVRSNFGTNGAPIKYAVLSALNPGAPYYAVASLKCCRKWHSIWPNQARW